VQIAIIVAATVCLILLAAFITRTRIGIGWRATVSDPRIAESFGVDAIKVRYLNFAIGSALAALGGRSSASSTISSNLQWVSWSATRHLRSSCWADWAIFRAR
jgi:branched-subunit amino acid ABC-type transport system permease component